MRGAECKRAADPSAQLARRPDRENAEILNEKDLKELRHNLAHLSITAVRDLYERAHRDCRLIYNPLPQSKTTPDARAGLEAVADAR